MRIIKHYNPYFPERDLYKCTIRNTTKYGTYEEVSAWRDDQMENEDYYKSLEDLEDKGRASFYANNHNNWSGD